jgi:hypothetical protein
MTDSVLVTNLSLWEKRFVLHSVRHPDVSWDEIGHRLAEDSSLLTTLSRMEATGGEPDLVVYQGDWIWVDLSPESPSGRRGLCYDGAARQSRKKLAPPSSAVETAQAMGIELIDEEFYFFLQNLEPLDTKTSSWLRTPPEMRKWGGALFGDRRFGRTFVFHNGADSYYSDRGFRGMIRVLPGSIQ